MYYVLFVCPVLLSDVVVSIRYIIFTGTECDTVLIVVSIEFYLPVTIVIIPDMLVTNLITKPSKPCWKKSIWLLDYERQQGVVYKSPI